MRIATDRCIIRDFDEADINEAHQYLSNPKTMYFIEDPYQKQRIGYEVLSALIKYAFGSMDIHKIVAETIEGNDACVKLLEKLSLTREATLRKQNWDHDNWVDEYHYGLLREEVV